MPTRLPVGHRDFLHNGFRRNPRRRGHIWPLPKASRILRAPACSDPVWVPCVRATIHGRGCHALVPSP